MRCDYISALMTMEKSLLMSMISPMWKLPKIIVLQYYRFVWLYQWDEFLLDTLPKIIVINVCLCLFSCKMVVVCVCVYVSHLQVIQTRQCCREIDLLQLQPFCYCRPKIWFVRSIFSAAKCSLKHSQLLLTFALFHLLGCFFLPSIYSRTGTYTLSI